MGLLGVRWVTYEGGVGEGLHRKEYNVQLLALPVALTTS
jgi:hypothetical protein